MSKPTGALAFGKLPVQTLPILRSKDPAKNDKQRKSFEELIVEVGHLQYPARAEPFATEDDPVTAGIRSSPAASDEMVENDPKSQKKHSKHECDNINHLPTESNRFRQFFLKPSQGG